MNFCKLFLKIFSVLTGKAGGFIDLKVYKKNDPISANDWIVRKIPGVVLLSHSQIYSTIAAGALNYRVREGNVCVCSAMDTGKKYYNEESLEVKLA